MADSRNAVQQVPTSAAVDDQTSGRLGKRHVASAVAAVLASACLLTYAATSGATLADPKPSARFYEVLIVVGALAFLTIGSVQSFRGGKLSPLLLMTVASGTAFWQEAYGDWGAYCLYSDRFITYGWGETSWAAPVRCWWFVPGYMAFYTSFFLGLMAAVRFARNRWPNANPYIAAALVSLPAFYVFDLVWEGTATGLGYWNYEYTFGPALHVGNGTFPLLWPIIAQVPFMALAAFGLMWRNRDGENVFDVAARFVTRKAPGQLAILVSWIVILNIAFLTTTILPIMALRWLAGPSIAALP
jgi:hypothetical protein